MTWGARQLIQYDVVKLSGPAQLTFPYLLQAALKSSYKAAQAAWL